MTQTNNIAAMSLTELQKAMEEGKLTSLSLVHFYMEQIARLNPTINAVIELNPDAEQIASVLDAERTLKGSRGSLHGIPILVKDNIDTGDKMHTSAGSLALKDSYAVEDAFIVKKLRAAGAVILGKANMTEWANFMSDHMPSGYSSRGGQVKNPYGPGKFDVGGSSAGSAAAVASHMVPVAIGTETSGSILNPASQNALVGIKPTMGLVSRSGIIPIAHSQDTAGPMTTTVSDAAILLNVLSGSDHHDPITALGEREEKGDYTAFLQADGLKGARIGISRRFFEECTPEQMILVEIALADMEEAGAVIIDSIDMPATKSEENIDVLIYEFKADLNAYLKTVSVHPPIHTLKDVLAFNATHADVALQYGQALLEASEYTSGSLTEAAYISGRLNDIKEAKEQSLDKAFANHQLDALVSPSSYGAGVAAKAGYPSICVPAGFTPENEPLGLSFTGKAFSERTLIKIAYGFEQATHHRKSPNLD